MKKFARLLSILLVLSFVLSCSMFSASAKEASSYATGREGMATILASAKKTDSFYLSDGTKITVAVVPAALTRGGLDIEHGVARPTATVSYDCKKNDGNHMYSAVYNIGQTNMNVHYTITGDFEGDAQIDEDISPDDRVVVYADSIDKNDGLTISVKVKITALRADSADYSYTLDQYWIY